MKSKYFFLHRPNVSWAKPDKAVLTCPDCVQTATETVYKDEFQWFQLAADALRLQHNRTVLMENN